MPSKYNVVQDSLTKEELKVSGFDIVKEQEKDKVLFDLKIRLQKGNVTSTDYSHHVVLDDILYYISNVNDNPTLRTYIPYHIKHALIKQYHDDNGHLGIDRVFDSLRLKYYWPNMYKDLYDYVNNCVTCKTISLKKIKPPLQDTDIPPYPFAKIGLDLSGPYPKSLAGNKYIIGFVDWYSGWCEAFAVSDKTADNVAHLLIDEIILRFGTPLEIVTDNGTENVNKIMKETFEQYKIKHITTSVYHPQSHAKVERFHRTLHDIMSKRLEENYEIWDVHLNQVLAAIRLNINESTKFSPYYLLYNRDPVLPLDNILKPRKRYLGDEPHKIGLQNQHKSFILVHNHLKKAKKRQNKYADRNAQFTEFQVGDPVYVKREQRSNKLQGKWKPYYRILEKRTPVTFIIENLIDRSTEKVHAERLRLANLEWEIPKGKNQPRKARYVVNPESSSSESSSDSEPDNTPSLHKIASKYHRGCDNSSDEDDIPLMELAKRLRARDAPMSSQESEDENMEIDYIHHEYHYRSKVKTLLKSVVGLL